MIDGMDRRMDTDGDEICSSTGRTDAILSHFMDGMDGQSLMETPLQGAAKTDTYGPLPFKFVYPLMQTLCSDLYRSPNILVKYQG